MTMMPAAPVTNAQTGTRDEIPTPLSPTGQYPDPVWTDEDRSRLIEAAAVDDDVPTPRRPTGQYPDPVWAQVDYGAMVAALDDSVSTPPSPTGQYPEPVWSDREFSQSAGSADKTAQPTPSRASAQTVTAPASPATVVTQSTAPDAPPSDAAPAHKVMAESEPASRKTLDNENIYRIVRAVAEGISGDDLYEWVDVSQQEAHGLRAGLVGFSQARGELGGLVQIMHSREPVLFAEVMGPHAVQLVQTLTAATQSERLQPVGGKVLWHPDWQAAFRQAGQHEQFRRAQNQAAIELQFRPMLPIARELGLRTDRGLALLYERVLELGLQNVAAWMRDQLDPPSGATESARLEALLASAGPERDRLAEVYNSSLLDGTAFEF